MLAVDAQVVENARMIEIDPKGYFVTGADTDVGKTYVACALVRQLRAQDIDVEPRKPVESGCSLGDDGELTTHDAACLQAANGRREPVARIAPYRFRAALAPHRAARLEGQTLLLSQLIEACNRERENSCLLVEGAGGFYSPLAEDGLNADLAAALQLALIIVVNDRIGAVNQSLLTLQAVENRQLRVAAIVLNQVEAERNAEMDNAADLEAYCNYPIFSCGHGDTLAQVFGNEYVDE